MNTTQLNPASNRWALAEFRTTSKLATKAVCLGKGKGVKAC
jgi:hypothetical protein